MPANKRMGSKSSPWMRSDNNGLYLGTATLIGIIKNNLDPTRSGRLQVYIPQFGGPDEDNAGNWLTVSYASPFRGQTRQRISSELYIDETIDSNNQYENSFQSYGFWFVPPDLNGKVLCVFVNGDPSQGYWTACIQDSFDAHMVPAIGAVTANIGGNGGYIWDPGKFATHQNLQQYIQLSSGGSTEIPYRLPVSEPVLLDQKNATSPSQVQMVPQVAQTRQLGIQGLCFDFIRGSTSASSIRENPSQVFGISTPGRLSTFGNTSLSKQVLSEIQTFLNSSDSSGDSAIRDALTTTFRTGGHQFVMDDGTVEGLDQGIRIRTTAGNMIQLDDTNGQIYIINSTGNAWIELSPSGFIDIYAKNDFSIRSQGDLNFHADKDILINANGSIKMHSQKALQIDSLDKTTIRSATDTTIFSAGNNKFGSTGSFAIDATGSGSIQSQAAINVKGQTINLNSGPGQTVQDPGPLTLSKQIDVTQQSGSKVWWQSSSINTIVERAPAHEPWPNHEINGIKTFSIAQGQVIGNPIIRPQSSGTSSGVRGTKMTNTLNESILNSQPTPAGTLCGLTLAQTKALLAAIGKRESGGQYNIQNSLGFVGKYQFGADALIDQGYMKPGSHTHTTNLQAINNPSNWTGKNGCNSVTDFRNNPAAQESSIIPYMQANCNSLKRLGVINANSTPEEIGGYLLASNLLGAGGAQKLYQYKNNLPGGSDGTDQFGSAASGYYSLGVQAIQLSNSQTNA